MKALDIREIAIHIRDQREMPGGLALNQGAFCLVHPLKNHIKRGTLISDMKDHSSCNTA